jgi:hypothetical protein
MTKSTRITITLDPDMAARLARVSGLPNLANRKPAHVARILCEHGLQREEKRIAAENKGKR